MQRSTSATVFGILNILFGGLTLLSIPFSLITLFSDTSGNNPVIELMKANAFYLLWSRLTLILGVIVSVVLIASGIGLLMMKKWARVAAVAYSLYSLFVAVVGGVLSWLFLYSPILDKLKSVQDPTEQGALVGGLFGGLAGGCFGLIYPAVLLYFMTRPGLVAAFEGAPLVATNETPPQTWPQTPRQTSDEVLATVIPFRNMPALISYYLGLFSLSALIPLLGVVGVGMAIAAFILGIKGYRLAKEHPEAKGTVHAWVGILCGLLWGILGILVQGVTVLALLNR